MSAKRKSTSSDLKRLDKMTDADIDNSDIPPLDESFFKKEVVTLPQMEKIFQGVIKRSIKLYS